MREKIRRVRPAVRLGLLFWSQDSSLSPFAKSSVGFGRMTHAGSTKLFRNKRLKSCLGRGQVYRPFRALHAQLAKRLTENELSDFSRLRYDGCVEAIIEAQHV